MLPLGRTDRILRSSQSSLTHGLCEATLHRACICQHIEAMDRAEENPVSRLGLALALPLNLRFLRSAGTNTSLLSNHHLDTSPAYSFASHVNMDIPLAVWVPTVFHLSPFWTDENNLARSFAKSAGICNKRRRACGRS